MKQRLVLWIAALIAIPFAGAAIAATLPGSIDAVLLPDNPTSADRLKLSIGDRTCGGQLPYKGNPYQVTMSQNNIAVTLGEHLPGIYPLCQALPREEVDLGSLPAGNYTISVIESAGSYSGAGTKISSVPFSVTDVRANKAAPYVRMDYSGHWWDPNDSGWGLFIWQDARSNTDSLLAAWFTYTPDGKPMWYVFQPTWLTSTATVTADMAQVSRLPGTMSPPPTARASLISAGTASLDFSTYGTSDSGKITYTFNGGPTLVRNIQRFKP